MLLQLYDEDSTLLNSCSLGEQGLRAINPMQPECNETKEDPNTLGLFYLLNNSATEVHVPVCGIAL